MTEAMSLTPGTKRKAESGKTSSNVKRSKGGKKNWVVPHKKEHSQDVAHQRRPHLPEPGDAGIWITCDMNKEAKAISEIRPLFEEHAARMYKLDDDQGVQGKSSDISTEIAAELDILRDGKKKLFQNIRIDTKCLLFFKTLAPIEPASFVLSYCQRAQLQAHRKETRSIRKLTPITMVGKASEKGVEEVAKTVLASHFHDGTIDKRFAIRINLRNHTAMKRDDIIKQVAQLVGPNHKVDLKNYDLLILVEVYQTIIGMSVVGNDYDTLKRYNLAEIYAQSDS